MEKNIGIIGLPETGKTTYIAALWHILDKGGDDTEVFLKELPENREYLNQIRDTWLELKNQERTKESQIKKIELKIGLKGKSDSISLRFPDVSGEVFNSQWEYRIVKQDYVDLMKDVENVILFVHSTQIKKPILISEIDEIFPIEHQGTDEYKVKEHIQAWNIEDAPTQVIIVELLQFLKSISNKKVKKITIFISAWDLARETHEETPEHWLINELPLVYQVLESHNGDIDYKVFGISAQGGDYEKDINSLQVKDPLERIFFQESRSISNNLAIPLLWLIE